MFFSIISAYELDLYSKSALPLIPLRLSKLFLHLSNNPSSVINRYAVFASAFADVIRALSPNSERAASLNSFVCAIKSSGPILMYGWIVGTTWLTFPASVEPIPNLSLRFTSSPSNSSSSATTSLYVLLRAVHRFHFGIDGFYFCACC